MDTFKQTHYCLKDCFYKEKSRNSIEDKKCRLLYKHDGNCNCGSNQHLYKYK